MYISLPLCLSVSLSVSLSPTPSLPPSLPASLSLSLSQESVSYTCHVSGPGLTSTTVNLTTQILTDSSGRPHLLPMNATAQLEPFSMATFRWPWSKKHVSVTMTTPSRYEVTYTPVSRGRHKLHVQVNDKEIDGSPFTVTVYPDPKQLG